MGNNTRAENPVSRQPSPDKRKRDHFPEVMAEEMGVGRPQEAPVSEGTMAFMNLGHIVERRPSSMAGIISTRSED